MKTLVVIFTLKGHTVTTKCMGVIDTVYTRSLVQCMISTKKLTVKEKYDDYHFESIGL